MKDLNDSMINPSIVELLERVDNRYSLVVATSRRARQIIDGEEPTVEVKERKPLTIAIDEVNIGNIDVKEGPDKLATTSELEEVEKANEEAVEGSEVGVEEGLE